MVTTVAGAGDGREKQPAYYVSGDMKCCGAWARLSRHRLDTPGCSPAIQAIRGRERRPCWCSCLPRLPLQLGGCSSCQPPAGLGQRRAPPSHTHPPRCAGAFAQSAWDFMFNGPYYIRMEEERVWEKDEAHADSRPLQTSPSFLAQSHDPEQAEQGSSFKSEAEEEAYARQEVHKVKSHVARLRMMNQVRAEGAGQAWHAALSCAPPPVPVLSRGCWAAATCCQAQPAAVQVGATVEARARPRRSARAACLLPRPCHRLRTPTCCPCPSAPRYAGGAGGAHPSYAGAQPREVLAPGRAWG
jgi:hypothetical protein